jgi:hypothetical protein
MTFTKRLRCQQARYSGAGGNDELSVFIVGSVPSFTRRAPRPRSSQTPAFATTERQSEISAAHQATGHLSRARGLGTCTVRLAKPLPNPAALILGTRSQTCEITGRPCGGNGDCWSIPPDCAGAGYSFSPANLRRRRLNRVGTRHLQHRWLSKRKLLLNNGDREFEQ